MALRALGLDRKRFSELNNKDRHPWFDGQELVGLARDLGLTGESVPHLVDLAEQLKAVPHTLRPLGLRYEGAAHLVALAKALGGVPHALNEAAVHHGVAPQELLTDPGMRTTVAWSYLRWPVAITRGDTYLLRAQTARDAVQHALFVDGPGPRVSGRRNSPWRSGSGSSRSCRGSCGRC